MPISTPAAIDVDDSAPVLIASAGNAHSDLPTQVRVQNDGSDAIFLGGPAVTDSTGITLAAASTAEFILGPGDDLYAICAASETATVRVLLQNQ